MSIILQLKKWYTQSGKQFGSFLQLNIHLPYDPAIPFLGIYPREIKIYVHTKPLYKFIFIAALFIITKTQKQSKCPSTGEWINKVQSTQWNTTK